MMNTETAKKMAMHRQVQMMKRELRILLRMKYYRYVHGEEIWWK